jgi:hypothetical protein
MYHSMSMFYGTLNKLKFNFKETYLKCTKLLGFVIIHQSLKYLFSAVSDDLLVTSHVKCTFWKEGPALI